MKELIYKCDLCEKDLKDKEGIFIYKTFHIARYKLNKLSDEKDLCIDCYLKTLEIIRKQIKEMH